MLLNTETNLLPSLYAIIDRTTLDSRVASVRAFAEEQFRSGDFDTKFMERFLEREMLKGLTRDPILAGCEFSLG